MESIQRSVLVYENWHLTAINVKKKTFQSWGASTGRFEKKINKKKIADILNESKPYVCINTS